MPTQGSSFPYEVYCNHCNVTFPAGTRRCLHCGGRLSRERGMAGAVPPQPLELEHVEEEEVSRRSPFSPVVLLWLVVFVVGTIYRACAGE
jgi:hypothetical protein